MNDLIAAPFLDNKTNRKGNPMAKEPDMKPSTEDNSAKEPETKRKPVVNHATIFEAISAATGEVGVLGKSERNKFDGYDFVSIDKFLKLVNPICARNGLFPVVNQREVEFYENTNSQGKKSVWARFYFDVSLYHKTGQQFGPLNYMVCVPMNGAQATGSAQSYCLKQFFRSILMVPTGDKDDPDFSATESHNDIDANKDKGKEPPVRDPWTHAIISEMPDTATQRDKAEAIATAICAQFKRMKGEKQIGFEWDRRAHLIEGEQGFQVKHPDLWSKVIDAYEIRRNEITEEKRPNDAGHIDPIE